LPLKCVDAVSNSTSPIRRIVGSQVNTGLLLANKIKDGQKLRLPLSCVVICVFAIMIVYLNVRKSHTQQADPFPKARYPFPMLI